jgi:hypothetical protein
MMRKPLLPIAAVVLALTAGCNYTKQIVYIDINNRSGQTMRNIEVTHPSGSYGVPELKDGQFHQYTAPVGSPCTFSLDFQDQAGKKYSANYDAGVKCPVEIELRIGEQMRVEGRTVRP